MKRSLFGLALLAWPVQAGYAQSEIALRQALEGQSVVVRIDMPASQQGIDVYPHRDLPVDFRQVGDRLKKNGVGLRAGQSSVITKVHIKGTYVEFQLGGGGYGTFGDAMRSPSNVNGNAQGKSGAERDLDDRIKAEPDPAKRKQLQRERDDLRDRRERANARAAAEAEQANRAADAELRARRESGGSRFNIRFDQEVPAEYLTPDGIMRALDRYVQFAGAAVDPDPAPVAVADKTPELRKGLSVEEVERLLGPAASASSKTTDGLTIMERTYLRNGKRVTTRFVSGVLTDYQIASQ